MGGTLKVEIEIFNLSSEIDSFQARSFVFKMRALRVEHLGGEEFRRKSQETASLGTPMHGKNGAKLQHFRTLLLILSDVFGFSRTRAFRR